MSEFNRGGHLWLALRGQPRPSGGENQAPQGNSGNAWNSHGNLRAHLDHPPARNLKIVGRIVGGAAERDEKVILPAWHSGMRGRLERAPRQEERRRHDVELPAELSRDRQRFRHVGRFHESEAQRDLGEGRADLFQPDPLGRIDPRRWRGFDGEDDIFLVQHLVVLEAVHQRRLRAGRFSSIAPRSANGNSSLRDFSNNSRLPRRQVYISSITTAPSANGTQPPSNTFKRFAARNVRSRNRNGAISAAAANGDHRHTRQMTTKPIIAVTTMVPVTEMP